jgi:hypothetical protein
VVPKIDMGRDEIKLGGIKYLNMYEIDLGNNETIVTILGIMK